MLFADAGSYSNMVNSYPIRIYSHKRVYAADYEIFSANALSASS